MFSVVDNLYGVISSIYLFNWSGQLNWSRTKCTGITYVHRTLLIILPCNSFQDVNHAVQSSVKS